MNKPGPISAKPLSALLGSAINDAFAKQGFASRELVTRWADIAGAHVAAHSEPLKIQWPRPVENQPLEPTTLILRVERPRALEIQHTSNAIGRIALRQAPLSRRPAPRRTKKPDVAAVARLEADLTVGEDAELRAALARLGAMIKRK